MNNLNQLPSLIAIAERALDVDRYVRERKAQTEALNCAYAFYKAERGLDRVERDSPEWVWMMEETKREYGDLVRAKNEEKNARRRLDTAIAAYKRHAREDA